MIHAASRDLLETVKWLCAHGAETQTLDKSGMAAIHHAVDGGYVTLVEWMLDNSEKYGFDIEQIEKSGGMTPLNRCGKILQYCASAKKNFLIQCINSDYVLYSTLTLAPTYSYQFSIHYCTFMFYKNIHSFETVIICLLF